MNMPKTFRTTLLLISVISLLSGCVTSGHHSVLPTNGPTMQQIYNRQIAESSDNGTLMRARESLPPDSDLNEKTPTQQTQAGNNNDVVMDEGAPTRLANPMIMIYVYPHFNGNNQDYVPGHLAYVTLYQKAQFALPGEAAES